MPEAHTIAVLVLVALWVGAGLIGSWLVADFFHRRSPAALPIRVGDIPFFVGMALLLGPFNLFIGLLFFIGWGIRRLLKRAGYDGRRVILPAKPEDQP